MSSPESSEIKTVSTNKGKHQKPVPAFMSMTWLRLHMKIVIYAVVATFIVSLFLIGYGTGVQSRDQEQRESDYFNSRKKEVEEKFSLPTSLQNKGNEIAISVTLDNGVASKSVNVDVKSLNKLLKNNDNYFRVQGLQGFNKMFALMQLKEGLVNALIGQNLVYLYAKMNNLVTDQEVNNLLKQEKDRFYQNAASPEQAEREFEYSLLNRGITKEELQEEVAKNIAIAKIRQSVVTGINPASATEDYFKSYYESHKNYFKKDDLISFDHLLIKPSDISDSINVDEGQVSAYYEQNKDSFKSSKRAEVYHIFIKVDDKYIESMPYNEPDILKIYEEQKATRFTEEEKVKASHILIKPRGDGEEEQKFEEAKKVILSIYEKAKNGEDFAKLASENSEDEGSAVKGGDLGFFGRGDMVKEFEDAAFSAEVGSITEPVRSVYGYHIIKVEAKNPEKVKPFEEVKNELILEAKKASADNSAKTKLEQIYNSRPNENQFLSSVAEISNGSKNKLPAFFKGELTEDYTNEEISILREEICDGSDYIVPEIEEKIFAMEKTALPAVTEVIKSQNGYHLFMVKGFLEPVNLKLSENLKHKIKDIIVNKNSEEEAQKLAEKLTKENPTASIEDLAKTYGKGNNDEKHTYTDLPFSKNSGVPLAELGGYNVYSDNTRTYLPDFHNVLLNAIKNNNLNSYIQPFKTKFGWNIVKVTNYQTNRFENFEDVRDTIRKITTFMPSDAEINQVFEENKKQFERPATRTIRQILCDNLLSAEKVIEDLNNGASFAMLAKRVSKDGSASNGGLMAPTSKGKYETSLDEAVWNLNLNEYTKEPIKTMNGYVVAYLEKETPEVKAELNNNVKAMIVQNLSERNREEAFSYFLKSLMDQANVVRNQELIDLLE